MKTKISFALMAAGILTTCALTAACKSSNGSGYEQDTVRAKDGTKITLTFYNHASIAVEANGHRIYIDPADATKKIAWDQEPKADLVLVTHTHYDHLSKDAIMSLNGTGEYTQLKPGESLDAFQNIRIDAVPAYNITPEHLNFHPKERGDAGYILTIGGSRIYVAGDTEDNPDVLAIRDIDIAFLPVNQPYTMTVEQCARVIDSIRPAVFYPYHYGGGSPQNTTDLEVLKAAVEGKTQFRLRSLE